MKSIFQSNLLNGWRYSVEYVRKGQYLLLAILHVWDVLCPLNISAQKHPIISWYSVPLCSLAKVFSAMTNNSQSVLTPLSEQKMPHFSYLLTYYYTVDNTHYPQETQMLPINRLPMHLWSISSFTSFYYHHAKEKGYHSRDSNVQVTVTLSCQTIVWGYHHSAGKISAIPSLRFTTYSKWFCEGRTSAKNANLLPLRIH